MTWVLLGRHCMFAILSPNSGSGKTAELGAILYFPRIPISLWSFIMKVGLCRVRRAAALRPDDGTTQHVSQHLSFTQYRK